jgi:hypothetical protein
MRFPLFAILAVFSSLAAALPAAAASVVVKSGSAFIDRGSGYAAVRGSTNGNPGDTVMVLVGGAAEIVYEDGCRTPVDVGSVVTIGQASPCGAASGGYADHTLIIGGLVVAGGVAAAIALSGDDSKPASQ